MKSKYLVIGTEFEHKGVLFMMEPGDFRLDRTYKIVARGVASNRNKLLTLESGQKYTVHSDWSVTPIK